MRARVLFRNVFRLMDIGFWGVGEKKQCNILMHKPIN